MKEFRSARMRLSGRASWLLFAAALSPLLFAWPVSAQDAPQFPARPNSPTAIRPRTAAPLQPVAEPALEQVPPEYGDGSRGEPREPIPNVIPPLPAPPLLPPPAWMNPAEAPAADSPRTAGNAPLDDPRIVAPAAYEPAPRAAASPAPVPSSGPASVAPAPITPSNPLKLPPPGRGKSETSESSQSQRSSSWSGSIVTVITSLSIVLGLFAVAVWMMRRGMGAAANSLPSEAVAVLGQLPLTGRQQILLVRIGPKLLLVSTNGETSSTLTEIEEPDEVDRIVGLCAESQPQSTTQTFRSLLAQMSSEPAEPGFLGDSHRHTRDLASSGAPARDD